VEFGVFVAMYHPDHRRLVDPFLDAFRAWLR